MFVTYEISPLMVEVTEHRRSFTHFLTGVCAIVGGVFTGNGFIVFETKAGGATCNDVCPRFGEFMRQVWKEHFLKLIQSCARVVINR